MGERQVLEQVDPAEGRQTLGVRLAPDGTNKEEFQYLKDQADQWADKIRSGTWNSKGLMFRILPSVGIR
jgi:uncharacterized protein YeaO (DUF488 family)